jgi:tetratricopeptide (TPR) repeat protein
VSNLWEGILKYHGEAKPCFPVFWRKITGLFLGFLLCSASLSGQTEDPDLFRMSDFARGEDLFLRDRPTEAVRFLEPAYAADPANVKAGLYLGMAYEQLRRVDDAIAVYRKLLPRGGGQTALIAYNLGNAYYAKGTASFAEQYYTEAIQADPGYASAYLNRANTRIKTGALKEAIPDYEFFLTLEPRSPKRTRIERLVSLLQEEFAAEENRRFMAEEAARQEEERKRRLLEEVSASLQAGAADTQGFSAGAEDVTGYNGEFELE